MLVGRDVAGVSDDVNSCTQKIEPFIIHRPNDPRRIVLVDTPGFEDMFRRVPCVEKLEQMTGFRPSIALPEIIDRVSAYQSRKKEFVGMPKEPANTIA